MSALVAEPEMAGSSPGDIVGEVLQSVLAEVLSTPWLVGPLVLLAIGKVVRLGRGVVHGRHTRDPRRRFSSWERAAILARAGSRCEAHSSLFGRCRETEGLQADHVHPHSRGGSTSVENGQVLCARHNKRKADRVPWNWELARLERRRQAYVPPGAAAAVVRHRRPAQPIEG